MPSVVNLNGYGARVATNHKEPGHSANPHYKFRPQMRGEAFDQPARVNYLFGPYDKLIPLSLCAFHEQRLIVVEVDVSTHTSLHAEHPHLSRRKKQFAERLLRTLRSRYESPFARLWRLIRGKRIAVELEGPFIPYEPAIALMTLAVRVSRDANYDHAYLIARKFLELHPGNESYKKFQSHWRRAKPQPKKKKESYPWTRAELRTIEDMAPLEPTDPEELGFYRSTEERLQYNARIWKRCLERQQSGPSNASEACDEALRDFFNMY